MTDKVVGFRTPEPYNTPAMMEMADELRSVIREIEDGRCAGIAVAYIIERTPADVYVHRRYAHEARLITLAGATSALNQRILEMTNES